MLPTQEITDATWLVNFMSVVRDYNQIVFFVFLYKLYYA